MFARGLIRFVVSVFVAWLVVAPAIAASGDAAVREAHRAYAARQAAAFDRAARDVPQDHVLLPYVAYWRLMLSERHDDARVADFLARYRDTRVAELARADWLKSLGAREAWSAYFAEYPRLVRPDIAHQCYAARAEWALGSEGRLRDAVALWFTGRDMPSACTPLFGQLIARGLINQEDIWRRLRLALDAGNTGVARAVAAHLPPDERPAATLFDQAGADPARVLQGNTLDLRRRGDREIALYALGQLARRSSAEAERALAARLSQFDPNEQAQAWARLATAAARRHEAIALTWFERAGATAPTDAQREWWARAALRAGQWPVVLRAIQSMSDATQTQAVWRYWRARALQAGGQRAAANAIFLPLANELHYYGQLAQEELGPVVRAAPINIKVGGDDVAAVARDPGIARALALHDIGLRSDAAQEWNWALREFDDRRLLAAAELARRNEWYDRAIQTAERTRELHDFDLRFVAPYRELAQQAARANGLDEAWVFGLMRQESRFITVARSGVGATGLMQVMPATARWIAQRLGIRRFDASEMNDPARNIEFGAYYLRHVQTTLDGSPVLATAAYNAGPGRAQRWRENRPMESAVYIETIPFAETRDYVKKVMSNAMYYAVRFGQPSVLLKDRLGVVPARRTPAPPDARLDVERPDD